MEKTLSRSDAIVVDPSGSSAWKMPAVLGAVATGVAALSAEAPGAPLSRPRGRLVLELLLRRRLKAQADRKSVV